MIIPKLGLMALLTGAVGFAQQPPPPPQQPQPPAVQASPQTPVTEGERKRFEEIKARRDRGEIISPEDQRFAQEIMARMNPAPRPAVAPPPVQQGMRGRMNQPPRIQAPRLQASRLQAPRLVGTAQPAQPNKPPLERALGVPGGRWWTRPEMAQKLGLSPDQTKKIDDTFQQYRLKLIDLDAAVRKEEVIMEPLVAAEQPDEAKIVAQIDKVAAARAELEKANARMLLGIRRLLTPEQWNKLKSEPPVTPQPVRR